MITNKQLYRFKMELDTIVEAYKAEPVEGKKYDWKEYERQWSNRLRGALKEIGGVITEADGSIKIRPSPFGRPQNLDSRKKALLLLIKDLSQFSNRKMANLLPLFSYLAEVHTSYKTVERTYSDPLVRMVLHNMFVILVKRKGIRTADITGDGTGYSLTITRHYRSVREKEGEKVKSNEEQSSPDTGTQSEEKKRKRFAYAFAIMDLGTWMYVGYGFSMRSEKDAFDKAAEMMRKCDVIPQSARLDQYYGSQFVTKLFEKETTIFVIPKDGITIRGPPEWKDITRTLMTDPIAFLKEYYRRENSESGFAADKKFDGWKVSQKLDERIGTAVMCKGVWHDLLWLTGKDNP